MLNDFFSPCGRIVAIRTTETSSDPDLLEALITFQDKKSAEKALNFNNSAMCERIIGVHRALDVDISHLENIPPYGLTERIQDNVAAFRETVSSMSEKLPEVKDAVVSKASAVTEGIGSYLSSAYDTVASFVGGGHQDKPEHEQHEQHEEKTKKHQPHEEKRHEPHEEKAKKNPLPAKEGMQSS
jgi:hypothetical protein